MITGNTISSNSDSCAAFQNNGDNCIITGNNCSSSSYYGSYKDFNVYANSCIIVGNICPNSGIWVLTGTCLPATSAAMADVNIGTITIEA